MKSAHSVIIQINGCPPPWGLVENNFSDARCQLRSPVSEAWWLCLARVACLCARLSCTLGNCQWQMWTESHFTFVERCVLELCHFKGSFYEHILLLVFIEPMSIFKFNLELPDAGVKCFTIRNVTYFSYCFPLTLPHCHCPPNAVDITETQGKAVPSVSSLNLRCKIVSLYRVCWLYLANCRYRSLISPVAFV